MSITDQTRNDAKFSTAKPDWKGVYAMAFSVFGLVTAEFLPASLLTPIATGLHVSQGLAGQAVTVTATAASITGLLIAAVVQKTDRRTLLLWLSAMLVIANLTVAIAPSIYVVLGARVLLGVAIGGFWTMAAATAMRLVPEHQVPRAMSVIFSGVSIATIAATPLGSFFESLIGWRNVFVLASAIGLVSLLIQAMTLPSMPTARSASLRTLLEVLRRPKVGIGIASTILIFMGHFAFFTYLRPFLEDMAGIDARELSLVLLGYGVANFAGTALAGKLLERRLDATLLSIPVAMIALAIVLKTFGTSSSVDFIVVALWGMAFGGVPVGWSTWIARAAPDEAETGGGIIVVAIQLAISAGAAFGGFAFDHHGATGVVGASAIALLGATLTTLSTVVTVSRVRT